MPMDYEDKGRYRPVRGGGGFNPDQFIEEVKRFFQGGGQPPGMGRFLAMLVVGIFAVVALFTSFYTVDVSYEGVVTRFGRYYTTAQPGLHFKLPFFIDKVYKVPSKVRLQEEFGFRTAGRFNDRTRYKKDAFIQESLMLTGDLNVADVEWIVQYHIGDPWKFLFHARDVRRTIRDVSMSIMRRVVGDRLVGEVLTTARVEIADQAKQIMQEVLDKYDIGIRIEAVMLQDVNPPESVKPAFNDVNAAKQEQEQAINNAEQQYNKVIPEARGKAQQVIAEAEAYGVDRVNRALGDASNFTQVLVEYRKAPSVTRKRLYLESMEQVFGDVENLIIVDSQIQGLLPLYPMGQDKGRGLTSVERGNP